MIREDLLCDTSGLKDRYPLRNPLDSSSCHEHSMEDATFGNVKWRRNQNLAKKESSFA